MSSWLDVYGLVVRSHWLVCASCLKHTARLQGGGLNENVLAGFKGQHLLLIVAKH